MPLDFFLAIKVFGIVLLVASCLIVIDGVRRA